MDLFDLGDSSTFLRNSGNNQTHYKVSQTVRSKYGSSTKTSNISAAKAIIESSPVESKQNRLFKMPQKRSVGLFVSPTRLDCEPSKFAKPLPQIKT